MARGARSRVVTALAAAALALVAVGAIAPDASAQTARGDTSSTTSGAALEAPDIIPRPDSGSEPRDAGDRGGAAQLAVGGLLVVALGSIGLIAARDVRRARARRAAQSSESQPSTPS